MHIAHIVAIPGGGVLHCVQFIEGCWREREMLLRWLWLFGIFVFNLSLLTTLGFFAVKAAETKILFGMKFESMWTLWGALAAVALPIYYIVNYLFFYLYWYGYKNVFPEKMWLVIVTGWIANLSVNLLVTWLYFGELPSKNAVVVLFFLTAATVAMFWK